MYQEIQRKLMKGLLPIPFSIMLYPTSYRPHLTRFPDSDSAWGINFYRLHFAEKEKKN